MPPPRGSGQSTPQKGKGPTGGAAGTTPSPPKPDGEITNKMLWDLIMASEERTNLRLVNMEAVATERHTALTSQMDAWKAEWQSKIEENRSKAAANESKLLDYDKTIEDAYKAAKAAEEVSNEWKRRVEELEREIANMKSMRSVNNRHLIDKINTLERVQREKNFRVQGFDIKLGESPKDTAVRNFEAIQADITVRDIETVYKAPFRSNTSASNSNKQSAPVYVVKFHSRDLRNNIYFGAKSKTEQFPDGKLVIRDDYTQFDLAMREKALPQMQAAWDGDESKTIKIKYVLAKLYIDGHQVPIKGEDEVYKRFEIEYGLVGG
jgi:hypothetical protein